MRLGLRAANQGFAKAIRAVRSGKEVILTDRGRPLAIIRRIEDESPESRLAALAAEGLVRPAARPGPMPSPRWRPERLTGVPIAETVDRDRDETA